MHFAFCISFPSPSFSSDISIKKHPNPVLSPGLGGPWDSQEVEPSAIIKEDGLYRMWFTAYDGKTYRIGYAISRNGLDWERNPQPILEPRPDGWDSFGVAYPCVIKDGDIYRMWYAGGDGKGLAIGYAVSRDGVKWDRNLEPVLKRGAGLVDLYSPWVIKNNDIYRMWFVGRRGETYRIGYAVSRNGIGWEDKGIGLLPGEGWDRGVVLHPMVLKEPLSDHYIILYSGKGTSEEGLRIGYALSRDGLQWERGDSPILEPGNGWDAGGVYRPIVLWDEHHYLLWYAGNDGRRTRVGLAFSEDGKAWDRYGKNPILDIREGRAWMDASLYRGTVIKEDGVYRLWFTGSNGAKVRIGHTVSRDGIHWMRSPLEPVLKPEEDGWDRMGVGYPSVIKEGGLYKMWYSGYDGFHLRIGYAVSRDGVHWDKYPTPVLDIGEEGGWEGVNVFYSSVIKDGSGYRLYYAGFDGKTQRIGLALSQDGINWERHPKNPILDIGEGLVGVSYPWVIKEKDIYRMWYAGLTEAGYRIFLAESKDGVSWSKGLEPVLDIVKSLSLQPLIKSGVSRERDVQETKGPMVLEEDGFYRMWYEEFDGGTNRIALAKSSDGMDWRVYEPSTVLDPSAGDDWESFGVAGGWILKEQGAKGKGQEKTYKMWYSGHDGKTYRIGYATSREGINWDRYEGNPVLDVGPKGQWDSQRVAYPMVMKDGDIYRMWYHGYSSKSSPSIGHAESPDGIHWEKTPLPILTPGLPGAWDGDSIGYPMVIKDGGLYRMWYAGLDDPYGNWRIGYAESRDGLVWVKFLQPVVNLGERGDWDGFHVSYPMVLKPVPTGFKQGMGKGFLMLYSGIDGGSLRIGIALSEDGIEWEVYKDNPILDIGDEGDWDEASVFSPRVLKEGDRYRLWYTGFDRSRLYRIGYGEMEYFDKER